MEWISCYDQLPAHKQQVIFRTDHEGVWSGRFYSGDHLRRSILKTGFFRSMTENEVVIGWNFSENKEHSEVHEWMPLPE